MESSTPVMLGVAPGELNGRHVLLGLTGGVACYKSAELCRLLIKSGATVQVMMTEAACQFITPVTMQALSGRPVVLSQWDARSPDNMPHIRMGREADVIVLAPCSADFIARLAQGRADELVSLTCLARPAGKPLLVAPAMNREMWAHPATQRNLAQIVQDGAQVMGVGHGEQACGEIGDGRMLEPQQLHDLIVASFAPKVLAGQQVLVTAGPTFEAIDPVRGITNHSSGKMGFAIARAAQEAGARVTLVAGPVHLPTPEGVRRIDVQSAQQMLEAVERSLPEYGIFIATAAVADWRTANVSEQKLKKDGSGQPPALQFVENPDILATVARTAQAQAGTLYCVGFAAESHDLEANAQAKRLRKQVPLLVGNIGPATFGKDDNALLLIDDHGTTELPHASKRVLAQQLVSEIARRLPDTQRA
ncbi:bifunctional phosphopantothenoylcysteine decarboxylase/phosphopantothenate--cysteine ligase CoaBC [Brachymonas denitrificans]|uniref:Coenzyme A biosynthesis bifunctional protein CoaBC n=1 Tax=Brachymonas denitrificans DSM 15123 TaxID=1121117 RepID=A0A1H8FCW6_9BURK|nr:bifunctional phosphopantothenoylcysteine decarboxylase/phosphopantothenate--cysteine ligase CoaBC [Brachymonas denitrificans]SEN29673.1 phosphopantothenoylcysteine decarboxylase / phosphopantothenate--cysteine ligase [Brachymonas denitrificans DSM 15123]